MNAHDALLEELRKHEASPDFVDSLELPTADSVRPKPKVMEMPEMDLTQQAPSGVRLGDEPDPTEPPKPAMRMPTVDTSRPIGFSPPTPKPVDAELEAAQGNARDRRATAGLGQAVTDYAERPTNFLDYAQRLGGGGSAAAAPKSSVWKDYAAEGDRGLADLEARGKSEAGLAGQAAVAAKARDAKDPNSQTAKTYRSILVRFAPELEKDLANATPEQMEKIAPWLEKLAADAKPPNRDPLEQAKLDETIRHNKMVEKQIHGHVPGQAAPPVAPGNYDSIKDPGERETVRAIVEGRAPAPAPGSKSGQHIMSLVAQVAPTFDSTKYGTYQHIRSEQSTNPSILASKAVRHHMDELESAVKDLDSGMIDTPFANRVAQGAAGLTGSNKYTRLQTTAKIVAAELAQALGEKDVEGRAMVEKLTDPTQTKEQWATSLDTLKKLRDEKLAAYQETLGPLQPTKIGEKPSQGGSSTIVDKNGQRYENVPASEVEALRAELESEGLL